MKKQLYALLLLASLGVGLCAQKADVTEANLRTTIGYLASDKLEGRRTGEPGATLAADYVASQFRKYKLRTAATGKNGKPSYKQAFPYITGVDVADTGNSFNLTIRLDNDNFMSIGGADFSAVRPVGCSTN